MDFISNQKPQLKEMLQEIGVKDVDELFAAIPKKLKLKSPEVDDGISEFEGLRWMEYLAAKNTFQNYDNYLGAGSYEHHVPAIVGAICSKSEFLTAYTPYQPEASQGMLQSIFEYQSAICALTGMDASNASVYDAASACAEALLMTLRAQKNKHKILISKALHPHYRGAIEQYLGSQEVELITIPFAKSGRMDMEFVKKYLDQDIASILVQSPNFFGIIEDTKEIATLAKKEGALVVLCANPITYGLFASAGELGADIAVGDCQPFGIPMQFGGPYAGYVACRQELVRQLPGRIVGETVDTKGRRGFVLTLQAREQHIRREKATSNICTNQALAALASLIAMLWYGKKGVGELALTNYQRASYLREQLSSVAGVKLFSKAPILNEFAVSFQQPADRVQNHFRKHHIEPGLSLEKYFPELKNYFLIAVTETKNKEQLDLYLEAARGLK
jgi:glycine dehydrogenase subunit 1